MVAKVIVEKVETNSLYKMGRLALVTPTFCYQIGHFATQFPSNEVGIVNFCVAHLFTKRGEKHRKRG